MQKQVVVSASCPWCPNCTNGGHSLYLAAWLLSGKSQSEDWGQAGAGAQLPLSSYLSRPRPSDPRKGAESVADEQDGFAASEFHNEEARSML